MFAFTHGNLIRQKKGMEVLLLLIEEEFAQLRGRKPQDVTATEFSIHELMRQIAAERLDLKKSLNGERLMTVLPMLPEEEQQALTSLLQELDDLEQECARKAERNADLALALHDQNQKMLDYISEQIRPKNTNTYGKMGGYQNQKPQAAIFRGRL